MRFFQVLWTLSRFTIFYKFTPYRNYNLGVRLKLAFEELGISYIKIGQILSMRYDILGREDCEELQQLLDNISPIRIEEIFIILEKEYGKPHTLVFKEFYQQPLGSASVSQVHKAITFDGKTVAVKIKRPDVDRQFFSDIRIMKRLAGIAELFSSTLRHFQIRSLVNYFESWIQQDLDFVLEVKNMKRIKEQYSFGETNFRHDLGKGIFIAPFENLCTANIIVMDFVDGIPMSRKEQILANPEYDIEKSIKTYINASIRNWFRDDIQTYLFQADPHLSNVLALPNGDAANIDCGLISELSIEEVKLSKALVIAVYMNDLDKVIKVATKMTGVSYEKYAPLLRPDLEKYLEQTKDEGLGFWFIGFAKIMVKHKIKFPLFLTTFGRTNIILDGLASTYLPGQSTVDLVGGELKRQVLKDTFKNIADVNWLKVGYALSEKVKQAPEIISGFIDNPLNIISEIAKAIKTAA